MIFPIIIRKAFFVKLKYSKIILLSFIALLGGHVLIILVFGSSVQSAIRKKANYYIADGSRRIMMTTDAFPKCPKVSPYLNGYFKVQSIGTPSLEEQEINAGGLNPGGRFKPRECVANDIVAIIIPYRSRESQLAIFLHNMHTFLQRQQLDYAIFVINQTGTNEFNRAKLFNVGVLESRKTYPYECFVFSDVDLIPENDKNRYNCLPYQPRHMSSAINIHNYQMPYPRIFGGVTSMTMDQLLKANGFSNKFYGWGGEDDDMSRRVRHHGLRIHRYDSDVARYMMLGHAKEQASKRRFGRLRHNRHGSDIDGLNATVYKFINIKLSPLYTMITVDI